jgi:hypothetical protein
LWGSEAALDIEQSINKVAVAAELNNMMKKEWLAEGNSKILMKWK